MFTAYVIVTVLTAVINVSSGIAHSLRFRPVREGMATIGIPASWMTPLGLCKITGAIGLIVGLFVWWIGLAAAIGLVLFFIGAIAAHLRVGDTVIWLPLIFLLFAIASLVLRSMV